MLVLVRMGFFFAGRELAAGQVVDLPDGVAREAIQCNQAVPFEAPTATVTREPVTTTESMPKVVKRGPRR